MHGSGKASSTSSLRLLASWSVLLPYFYQRYVSFLGTTTCAQRSPADTALNGGQRLVSHDRREQVAVVILSTKPYQGTTFCLYRTRQEGLEGRSAIRLLSHVL